ncbi:MAG TPA: PAS domain S-box protein [Leptolyngbyaceae cyanobacterium]
MKRDRKGKFVNTWDSETKQRVSVSLTPTAWRLLDEEAQKRGISRSELIEQVARSFDRNSQEIAFSNNNNISGTVAEEQIACNCKDSALQEAESRVATILESISDAFVAFDRDWRYTYANKAATQLLQKSREELIGKHVWTEVFPHVVGELPYQELHRAVAQQVPVSWIELGRPMNRWLEVNAYPSSEGVAVYFRDITERKETEAALKQSRDELVRRAAQLQQVNEELQDSVEKLEIVEEELRQQNEELLIAHEIAERESYRYQDLFNFAPDGYVVTDANGKIQEANRAIATLIGCEAQELIGLLLIKYIAEETRQAFRNLLVDLRQHSQIETEQLCLKAIALPNSIPVSITVTAIYNERGQFAGARWLIRDITERKQVEAALQESEERLSTLADNIAQLAWMADANGWLFWYNQRWFEYTGTTLEEMEGWGWQKVHHPEHLDRVIEHFRHCLETGEIWEDTFPLRGKDGRYRWFLSRAIPIHNRSGKVLRWFGTNTDITDRKQAEEALQESEQRYRLLVESIPQLVWTANAEGTLLDLNQRWSDFTGLTLEEAKREGWEAVVHPDDIPILGQNWAAAQQNGGYYQAEGRMRRGDGVYRWHLHQAIPVKNEKGEIVKWFGTATDIEERKQLEQQLDRILHQEQAAREAAEQANRIKDEFLAVLSHELRSPLNPILGWTSLLRTRKLDAATTERALETIERNTRLQSQLIEDLLDISRILRGKLRFDPKLVNLATAIEQARETVRLAAEAKSIQIEMNLHDEVPVMGDAARLQQVVWNLLSNAVKFTPCGGKIEILLQTIESEAQIIVKDTGRGISSDFLPYVFDYFRQADSTMTRQFGGLGLGLAIVRHLVELHGGTVAVESSGEGKGATFTVQLPLAKLPSSMAGDEEAIDNEMTLAGIKALVVDDELDMRELTQFILEQSGASVQTASSAKEALALLTRFVPDILICDIGMPEMDGYTLLQKIRLLPPELGSQVPAIALTAYAGDFDRQRALEMGFEQHLSKPVDPKSLVNAIAAICFS